MWTISKKNNINQIAPCPNERSKDILLFNYNLQEDRTKNNISTTHIIDATYTNYFITFL